MLTIVIGAGSGGGGGDLIDPVIQFADDPTAAPVAPPSDGDRYIVGTGAGGTAWENQDDKIAEYEASTGDWVFTDPEPGMMAVVESNDSVYVWDESGQVWAVSVPRIHASSHEDGGADEIDAGTLGSGAATSGQVLTADGGGGNTYEDPDEELPHGGQAEQGIAGVSTTTGTFTKVGTLSAQLTLGKTSDVFVFATFDVKTTAGGPVTPEFGIVDQSDGETAPPAGARITRYLSGTNDLGAAAVQRQASGETGSKQYELWVDTKGATLSFDNVQLSAFATKVE